MSKQLKLRRGTTAQHSTFTGASGEVTVDTTKKALVVHDGTTAGGVPMATEASVTTGLAGKQPLATELTAIAAAGNAMFKNRIINGAMMIDQRNAGASVTPTPTGQNVYTLDRWAVINSQASKFSVQQNAGAVTPPAGYKNYIGMTSLAATSVGATDYFQLAQLIEGLNVADFAWGTTSAAPITISFWVRSSLTGLFGGALLNADNSRSYPYSYTINSANTWEQKTITVAGDTTGTWLTTNGVGLQLRFSLGVGATYSTTANAWASGVYGAPTGATSVVGTNGATFYITGVQLEKGSTATSFDYRPYGTELALCQRYFEKSYDYSQVPGSTVDNTSGGYGIAGNTTLIPAVVYYKVTKRITGNTVTIYAYDGTSGTISSYNSTGNMGATGCTFNKVGETGFTGITKTGGTNFTAGNYYWWNWTSSAEL